MRGDPRLERRRAEDGTGRLAREAAGRSRSARAPRQGRQGPGELERADDRRAGAGRRESSSSREYLIAAEKAAELYSGANARPDGRLLHTWRHGQAKLDAYLDDYAYFVNALVTLYEATFNERWIDEAVRLADFMLKHFEDHERGGFFFTADDHEQLIARNKDLHDASVPSGNAMAATALLRLGRLSGRTDYLD